MGCFLSRGYVLMQDVLSVGGRNDFYGNTAALDVDFIAGGDPLAENEKKLLRRIRR